MQTIIPPSQQARASCRFIPRPAQLATEPSGGQEAIDAIAIPANRPARGRRSRRPRRRRPGRRHPWRILAAILLLATALAATALAVLPHFLPSFLERLAREHLGLAAAIGRTTLSLADQRLVAGNVVVGQDRADAPPLFTADRIVLDFSLTLSRGLRLEQVEVDNGRLAVIRRADGSTNIGRLWDRLPASAGTLPSAGLRLVNARVEIDDRLKGRQHRIDDLYLELPPLTGKGLPAVLAGRAPLPSFRARINASPVTLAGRLESDAGSGSRIRFQISRIDLADYLPYLPPAITAILSGGTAAADLDLGLENGEVVLRGTLLLQEPTIAPPLSGTAASARIGFAVELASRRVRCERLLLTRPQLAVTRGVQGWQLPWSGKAADSGSAWRFSLGTVQVEDGNLEIIDQAVAGGFSLRLTGIQATRAADGTVELHGTSTPGGTLRLQGTLSERGLRGEFHLEGIGLAALSPYLRTTPVEEGRLAAITGRIVLSGQEQRLAGMRFTADGLAFRLPPGRLVLRRARVAGMDIDFRRQTVTIERLTASRTTPLSTFQPASTTATPPDASAWRLSLQSAVIEAMEVLPAGTTRPASGPPSPTPVLRIEDLQLLGYDSASRTPACRVAATLLPAAGGTLQFSGTLHPSPLRVQGRGLLDGLPLAPYQDLLLPRLDGQIRDGTIRGRGSFSWPDITFEGDLAVRDLVLDRPAGQPLLAWQEAQAQGVLLDGSSLACRTLAIDRPRAFLRLAAQGRSNISGLFGKGPTQAGGKRFAVTIGELLFSGGSLHLTDDRLTPPFRLALQQVDGTLSSLANQPENRCQVRVQGQGPQGSTLALAGRFGFFAPELAARCTITAQRLPITLFAPYLAAELGHEITGGTVDINSQYQRHEGRIDAENELVVRDLALGRPLRPISRLPLTLALLTGPDGTLRLSLPVHGNLADANFSFRTTLFGVLRNLLLQTAVTPFTMLAKLLPDIKGPDLDLGWIEFAPGSATLDAAARERLLALARVLEERPALNLAITGQADLGRDRLAMATKRRQQQLKARFARQERLARQLASRYRGEELATSLPPPAEGPAKAVEVSDADLQDLARRRAQAVADFLRAHGVRGQRLAVATRVELVPEGRIGRPGTSVRLRPATAGTPAASPTGRPASAPRPVP